MPRSVMCVAVCVLAGAAVGCGDWPWQHDMGNQPSYPVATVTRGAVPGTIAIGSELPTSRDEADTRLQNPIPADAPVDAGRVLYRTYCSPCHGESANGGGSVSQYFGAIPDLTTTGVQSHGDGWLYETITNGTERMPRYEFELTSNERWQIVHFLRFAGAAQ